MEIKQLIELYGQITRNMLMVGFIEKILGKVRYHQHDKFCRPDIPIKIDSPVRHGDGRYSFGIGGEKKESIKPDPILVHFSDVEIGLFNLAVQVYKYTHGIRNLNSGSQAVMYARDTHNESCNQLKDEHGGFRIIDDENECVIIPRQMEGNCVTFEIELPMGKFPHSGKVDDAMTNSIPVPLATLINKLPDKDCRDLLNSLTNYGTIYIPVVTTAKFDFLVKNLSKRDEVARNKCIEQWSKTLNIHKRVYEGLSAPLP
jgi:hypothetical protein